MAGVTSRPPPTVTRVIPGETAVLAVTSLNRHVYVVRQGKKEVEVYDAATLTPERRLPISEISFGVADIAACSRNNCLYLSNWNNPSIHRVSLGGITKWPVPTKPRGLPVNVDHNVLVTCLSDKKVHEYTTDERLVREICLPAGLGSPWHAVRLSTGGYAVSHHEAPGVVRVVREDGGLIGSFKPLNSTNVVGAMKYPRSLAATAHGDVLVADAGNHRILAINFSIARAQVFPVTVDVDLRAPCALYLDDTRDRLYIGEMGGTHRVIVLNNASCIPWQL